MTKHYAVLGSPISHSKSPLIHREIFSLSGVDADYQAFELAEGLREWVLALDQDWLGLSLTMPLKKQALDLALRADPVAIAAQAANTLVRVGEGWDAYNTDVFGINQTLKGQKFSAVCVLGTGATARSAIVAMLETGKRVSVWGRDPKKLNALAAEFEIEPLTSLGVALSQPAVISTLVAGAIDDQLSKDFSGILLDAIYHPWPTELAKRFPGQKVFSGFDMLIWQAIGQQRLFQNQDLDTPLKNERELVSAVYQALSVAK